MAIYQHDNQGKCDFARHNQVANELDVRLEMPYTRSSIITGLALTTGAARKIKWATGDAIVAGTKYSPAAASGFGTDNAFSWVYLNSSGVVSIATTKPTGNYAMVGVAQASGNAIIKARNLRMRFPDLDGSGNCTIEGDYKFKSGTAFIGTLAHNIGAARTWTLPDVTGTVALLEAANVFTANQTMPVVIGGTGTTSTLSLRSTSGVGAAGADIIFQVGNNGATEAVRILNDGKVGIGIAAPGTYSTIASKLDVRTAGTHSHLAVSTDTGAAIARLTLANTNQSSNWLLDNRGTLDTPNNRLAISYNAGADLFTILTGGMALIGDTANANMTVGLTINQGGNDNEILALKSSDVAHGVTSITETDTFASFIKIEDVSGGLIINCLSDINPYACIIRGVGTGENTAKTTAGTGTINLESVKASGTGTAALGVDGNLVVIRSQGAIARFIFDVEGSAHADVEWITFAHEHDLAVLDAFEAEMTGLPRRLTPARYGQDSLAYHRAFLEEAKIVGRDSWHEEHGRPRAMVNFTRLSMLHHGAILQLGERQETVEVRLERAVRALVALGVDPTALN